MLLEVMFSLLTFVIPNALELEAKDYAEAGETIEEVKDDITRTLKLDNGVILKFDANTKRLIEFSYEGKGLKYWGYVIGQPLQDHKDFDVVSQHDDCLYLYKHFEDASVLLVVVKDGVIEKITRFAGDMTVA